VEDGTQVSATGLESKQYARIPVLHVRDGDRLVKKWKNQCDNTEASTAIVRNIQVDLGNITAHSISAVTLDKDFDFLNAQTRFRQLTCKK
jgi:hypothetical protein